ncbi:MAG: pilus assembly protein PilM [Candidatus Wolfebacteria bacterium]|nr:pilus assembly protein PilM [Candidatus Wolfebacteria bacterium]
MQSPAIIADVGSRSTNIIVADKGLLRHSIQTDYAGSSLTQAIANGLGIEVKRAEEIKKQKGILTGSAEYELSTLTLPFLDVILNEVKRVRSDYEKSHGLVVEKFILAGGGANLLGFEDYAREQLGLPVSLANPFSSVGYLPEIQSMAKELGPVLSTAIGLGLKEFVQ